MLNLEFASNWIKQGWSFTILMTALALGTCLANTPLVAEEPARNSPQQVAKDWPQFLGPNRNGISSETGLLTSWPAGGPKVVWRAQGGVGMSGLAISQGRLVTLLQNDGKQRVVAHDAKSGKRLWEAEVGPSYRNPMGNGPRSTPTIVGDRLYAFTGEGILLALKLGDGKIVWRHNVVEELGGKGAEYGMACSPLVVEDQVIVTAGVPGGSVVAYDRSTGKLAWKIGRDTAGYSSPALLNVAGRKQIVVFTGKAVMGLSPKTGDQLWRYQYATNFDCNIATPLADKGRVFISCGENHGSALLAFKPRGTGYDVEEVWTSFGPRSVMRNEWQTSMLLDGYLYGMDNVGGAGPITHLNCVELATGKRVWQQRRFGKGNLIAADGKLFISTMNGELVVVRATPERFEEIGRTEVLGATRQAPALAGGLLYLRDDREIVCLNVREPTE